MTVPHTAGQLSVRVWRPESSNPRYIIDPLHIELHSCFDGSGTKKYPNDVIYSVEQANADAHRLVLCWNSHDYLVAEVERLKLELQKATANET